MSYLPMSFTLYKVSDTKPKKGQMSALEMFAAKPSTSKTEKKSNKKEDTQQDKEKVLSSLVNNFI